MKRSRNKLKLAQAHDLPWVSIEFPSSLERAGQVGEEILAACRRHHFNDQDIFAIKLALEEALVNAVKHGNKLDSAKRVRVQYRITDQRADVAIEDQGAGFNPVELPDPTADENLCRCCGRGILLMRAYMSNVVFNPKGNKVTLTKFNENCPTVPNAAIG
ncbi:MAG: ATP-binding protein [Phycisphaerales bacterium]|nr:ATP-binding protein [Phycisphaerales bacterium]